MKFQLYVLTALAYILAAACAVQSPPAVSLKPEKFDLQPGQRFIVDANSGIVDITSANASSVELTGWISTPQYVDYGATIEKDGVHIRAIYKRSDFLTAPASPIRLELRLPAGTPVNFQTDEAAIYIHDYSGQVNVSSVTGEVHLQNASGQFLLNSNRGDITVNESGGVIQVTGNYGKLSLLDSHGKLSASTIVGAVSYSGSLQAGDNIHLETDRGPVDIQLGQTSDAAVQLSTTSGELNCTIPGINYEGRRCSGILKAGQGTLTARTVSGPVTLQQIP